MQLTHLSVLSVLAAASGANAFPAPALPESISKFLNFGSSEKAAPAAAAGASSGAPAAGPAYATGSYNATGNLTARFHARAVHVDVVNYNTTANFTGTSNSTVARRSVPEVVVSFNSTGNATTASNSTVARRWVFEPAAVQHNSTGSHNTTAPPSGIPTAGNWTKAPRFRAARRAVPSFGIVNYNATAEHGHGGEGHLNGTVKHNSAALAPAPVPAPSITARAVAGAVAAVDSAVAAGACSYPAQYVLTNFTSFAPNFNSSNSYVSFAYSDASTSVETQCSYNASSTSLTAGAGLAPRYPCDNTIVSFIWAPVASSNSSLRSSGAASAYGKLTLIEETCPGQTASKFESTGSVSVTNLRCTKISGSNATAATELATGTAGVLCSAEGSLVGNFTSLQPSPLE